MISNKPICVTGVSGFIASYIVKELLAHGYAVRGTVRRLSDKTQYDYLTSLPGAAERLKLVQAELLTEGSYDDAVSGCEYVIHTASPYIIDVKDPQRDLVDPAVKGTLNILQACAKSGSVKKVVLTSSEAALYDEPISGHVYSEKDWNQGSTVTRNSYQYSKTAAERAAWDFIERERPEFKIVVINPTGVIGPSIVPSLNITNKIVLDVLAGKHPVILDIWFALVDVRDVAHAHILAMENEKAQGRYICTSETVSSKNIVDILQDGGFGQYKLPKLSLAGPFGNKLAKLLAYTQPRGTRIYIQSNIGRTKQFNTSKARNELGISFRPMKETILETTRDLIRWKHLPQRM